MKRIINIALAGFAAVALAVSLGGVGPAFAQMKEKEKTVSSDLTAMLERSLAASKGERASA